MERAAVLQEQEQLAILTVNEPAMRVRITDAVQMEQLFVPPATCAQLSLRPFQGEATVLHSGALQIVMHATRESFQLSRKHMDGHISIGYAIRAENVMHRGRPCGPRDIILLRDRDAELNFVGPAEFVWVDIDLARLPEYQVRMLLHAAPERDVLYASREYLIAALRHCFANLVLFNLNSVPMHQLPRRESELIDLIGRVLLSARAKPSGGKRERAFNLVQHVESFMWDNVEDPLSLLRICEVAGCRARSLTYYFKALVGVGPMTFLKIRRLENVHRRLQESNGGARIFDIAADFGFWHMGHFSTDYRRMFGTTASETRSVTRTG
jgi:AraC family ethanolamine operon transcriptional activator